MSARPRPCRARLSEAEAAEAAAWLAAVFAGPIPAGAAAAQRRPAARRALAALGEAAGEPEAAARLTAAFAHGTPEAAARASERRVTALFHGAGGPRPAPLCESACAPGPRPRLFGPPAGEMREVLRGLGLSVEERFGEPDDHVSVQLAALAAAIEAEARGTAAALADRLRAWTPRLRDALAEADPGGPHHAAAVLLVGVLAALPPPGAAPEGPHRTPQRPPQR